MKRQDIFDKVYKHVLEQDAKSLAKNGSCLYKSIDGSQCAIGCLIDDKNYNIDLEHRGITSSLVMNAVKNSNKGIRLNGVTMCMLERLQCIHDDSNLEAWEGLLRALAKNYNLKIPA